jgi:HPt (histidine-containing phosphotransfer) domain-containing protein
MTANAMQGDRERCLEAGMDAYVAKPIKTDELFAVIEELLPTPHEADAPVLANADLESGAERRQADRELMSMLNCAEGLARVEGDEELYRELLELFRDDAPLQMHTLEQALQEGNLPVVERQAHTLKGAAANVGASAVRDAALGIECAARHQDLAAARTLYDTLRSAFLHLQAVLDNGVSMTTP